MLVKVAYAFWSALRSLFFFKPLKRALDLDLSATVALTLVSLAVWSATEYITTGSRSWFSPVGLMSQIGYFAVLIGLLSLLRLSKFGASAQQVYVGVVSLGTLYTVALLLVSLASTAFSGSDPNADAQAMKALQAIRMVAGWYFLIVSVVFSLPLFAMIFRMTVGLTERWRLAAASAVVMVEVLASLGLPITPSFTDPRVPPFRMSFAELALDQVHRAAWSKIASDDEGDKTPPRPRIDYEAVITRQPQMLASSLASLAPPTNDQGQFFFVGMAPYADQDVFQREITAVKTLFDDSFATKERSLLLSNNASSLDALPLASMTNLEGALAQIGAIMRPDKDVLVLFVTSHGSKGIISVEAGSLPLNTVTPERLATALDKAHIQNRVIILSACYSGSFIEKLKGDNTLIMTASDADHTSFGCSNERQWTYFGDAFFNRALRTHTSMIEAFGTAKDLIGEWEQREKLTPSNPQISIGSAIREKLANIQPQPTQKASAD